MRIKSKLLSSMLCLMVILGAEAYQTNDTSGQSGGTSQDTHAGGINNVPLQDAVMVDGGVNDDSIPPVPIDSIPLDGTMENIEIDNVLNDFTLNGSFWGDTDDPGMYNVDISNDGSDGGILDNNFDDGTLEEETDIFVGSNGIGDSNAMNCYHNGIWYEEGDGVVDTTQPCKMHFCEFGQMKPFYTSCYMDGQCYNEGETWKSGCTSYTCVLTSRGFLSKVTGKGCEIRFKGVAKCLKDGETARDAPCVKRRCKVSEDGDNFKTDLVLVSEYGGCNRRGKCYVHGQTYMTPKTCVTRTCNVNHLIQKAWFEETGRGCRFAGACVNEGENRIRRCTEFTCTRIYTRTGKLRMVMKKTNTNVCKNNVGYH